jgi:hypothetical protein
VHPFIDSRVPVWVLKFCAAVVDLAVSAARRACRDACAMTHTEHSRETTMAADTQLSDAERCALEVAYQADIGPQIRRRLHLAVFLFLSFVGTAVYAERLAYPARASTITTIYGAQLAAAALGLGACHVPGLRRRTAAIAASAH